MRPTPVYQAVLLALGSALLAGPVFAQAVESELKPKDARNEQKAEQNAEQEASKTAKADAESEAQQVIVVGTRASQQTALAGKKKALNAVDMIVAEDVGSFPDRNVAEAISRISGISLDRGDFGEGVTVDVRGNGPDLTRVEIDGMGVQSAGGTNMNLGGGGRGVELRELPSDLIQSVTVVKGQTADMTEGSLGGSILIKTRTGLDFKKRFVSARVAGTRNTLNDKWSPSLNLTYADKFLGGRLGIVATITKTDFYNESHWAQQTTSGTGGYARFADFDGSPEKTFTYQPQTVIQTDPAGKAPILRLPRIGGGEMLTDSPFELLTKAAGAKTMDECLTIFPAPSAAELGQLTSANQTSLRNFRRDAAHSCAAQWYDYTPSLMRSIIKRQRDKRLNADLRADFKVTNNLTVFAKYMATDRSVIDEFLTYNRGTPSGAGTFRDEAGRRIAANATTGILGGFSTSALGTSINGTGIVRGIASNVVPGSIKVDKKHFVTEMSLYESGAGIEQIYNEMISDTKYMQTGATYRNGGFRAEFMASASKGDFYRGDAAIRNAGITIAGTSQLTAEDGAWRVRYSDGSADGGQSDPLRYTVIRPNASTVAATEPMLSNRMNLIYQPRAGETEEAQAKLDLSYSTDFRLLPFLKTVRWGGQRRAFEYTNWDRFGGYLASTASATSPAVAVQASEVRSSFGACQPTTVAGAKPCNYGYSQGAGQWERRGDYMFTPAQWNEIWSQVMHKRTAPFFGDASGRPAGLADGWMEIDVPKLFELAKVPHINQDCVRTCLGTDGKMYNQLTSGVTEKITSGYVSTDFDFTELPYSGGRTLPWGMQLDGNFGVRVVHANVTGRGHFGFTAITKTAQYTDQDPNNARGISTLTVNKETGISRSRTDYMPMLNLNLWPIEDKVVLRYNRSKVIAPPRVESLYSRGSCTWDQRNADKNLLLTDDENEIDMGCQGDIGNPALRPRVNINTNWSLEWYANKDTSVSASVFRQRGIVGAPRRITVDNSKLFEGMDVTAPGTNFRLSDLEFRHTTLVNAEPTQIDGWEVQMQTAFTYLPSFLRYMGMSANYSKQKPKQTGELPRELTTGDYLDPQNVPRFSYNASLWYDDGKLQAKASLQVVAQKFLEFSRGHRNYPSIATGWSALPWNPSLPNFVEQTRFIDLKVSYKVLPSVEVFAEVRNATQRMLQRSHGQYGQFENGDPALNELYYAGRHTMFGVNFRY
jgi:TonB-dependent receptor